MPITTRGIAAHTAITTITSSRGWGDNATRTMLGHFRHWMDGSGDLPRSLLLYTSPTPQQTDDDRPVSMAGPAGLPAVADPAAQGKAQDTFVYMEMSWEIGDKIREIMDHRRILLLCCRNVSGCTCGVSNNWRIQDVLISADPPFSYQILSNAGEICFNLKNQKCWCHKII